MGNRPLDPILWGKIMGGPSGGSVTPASIVTATGQMTDAQAAETRENLGAEPEKFVVTVTEDDVTGDLVADKTFTQIMAAVDAGKTVVAEMDGAFLQMFIATEDEGIGFCETHAYPDGAMAVALFVDDSDTWSIAESRLSKEPLNLYRGETSPSFTPVVNTIYHFTASALTSLTISNPPATGKYVIIFFSGATATTTVGIENFVAEANKRYKITVEDNYATYDSWPYTPT